MSARPRAQEDDGFTLVELLVAIVITGIIGSVVLGSVIQSLQISSAATTRVDALTDLQRTQQRVVRNVRAADPIGAATPTTLRVTVYDDAVRRRVITYTHAGDTLTQRVQTFASPSAAASSDVTTTVIGGLAQGTTPVFTYSTATGATWTTGSVGDIARVTITLITAVGDDTIRLSSGAHVRNSVD